MLSKKVHSVGVWSVVIWAALAAAFVLSVFLAVGLCTEACKATYNWTIFRMKFPLLGIGFFALCLMLYSFRDRPVIRGLFPAVIAGAWGAEATFLYVQHSIIERWCPMCLAVAFCVFVAGVALASGHIAGTRKLFESGRELTLRILPKAVFLVAVAFAGAGISFYGLGNPADSHAQTIPVALGKQDSDIEVYVFTDWFCNACRAAEPDMDKAYPNIAQRAKLLFIDQPIHPESMNYIPFNLSFLVREKEKYLEIRKALSRLALQTKTPTPEDVQKAVAPLGVTYRPLNYSEVNAGIQYFQSVAKAFRVEGTPSIAVYNRKAKTTKLLVGTRDLSYANILMAVSGVSPP